MRWSLAMWNTECDCTTIIVLPVMGRRGWEPVAMLYIWSRWDALPEITPLYGGQYWYIEMSIPVHM